MELARPTYFEQSTRAVLAQLHQTLGHRLWMLTQTVGDEWIVLIVEDHGYNVEEGTIFRWSHSYCSSMVEGKGPRIAPHTGEIPAYVDARINEKVPIKSYIGVPVNNADGSLFGTLCAIDPDEQSENLHNHLPLIELCAQLIGNLLEAESRIEVTAQKLERSIEEASVDTLTGVLNRTGWEKGIVAAEIMADVYGQYYSVAVVDLDDLKKTNDEKGHLEGDALIKAAADCLRQTLTSGDKVARIGGDEFAVIAKSCDVTGAESLFYRITNAFSLAGINASVGIATQSYTTPINEAFNLADRRMYEAKAVRKLSFTTEALKF